MRPAPTRRRDRLAPVPGCAQARRLSDAIGSPARCGSGGRRRRARAPAGRPGARTAAATSRSRSEPSSTPVRASASTASTSPRARSSRACPPPAPSRYAPPAFLRRCTSATCFCTSWLIALPTAPMKVGRFSAAQSHARVAAVVQALEPRHHVAREELVAPLLARPVRPVVGHEEEGAEAARLRLEALELRDRVVGRADHREARSRASRRRRSRSRRPARAAAPRRRWK